MKRNNIKTHFFSICLSAICLMVSGCADLDENPSESLLSPEALNTPEALDAAIAGAYRTLQANARWSHFYIAGYAGDDMTTHSASNKAGFRAWDQRNVTATTERLDAHWNSFYNPMRSINTIIELEGTIEGGDPDQIDIRFGEAYFIRAFLYFNLTRSFGEVPLHLTSVPDPDLGKSSIAEVYAQVESDLLKAEALLPDIHPDSPGSASRPNRGSARAYLSQLYLHWAGFPLKDDSKYAMAAAKAKQVIDNAGAHGFALVDDMDSLWSNTDENRFNSEGVFSLIYCVPCGVTNRYTARLGYPGDVGGWTETFAEIKFMEDMPDGPRKEASYITELEVDGQIVPWQQFGNEPHPLLKKITGHPEEIAPNSRNTNTSITTYFMRYAEVLLTYAEASARAGNAGAEAWEALNQVRRRAYGQLPYTDPQAIDLNSGDLAELTYEERRWETAGEFKRWHDLVRMERVEEALSDRSPDELNIIIGGLGTDNYFAPVPQSEVDRAPQLGN